MMHDAPSWEALIEYDETGEVLWCGGPPEETASWHIDPAFCAWRQAQARAPPGGGAHAETFLLQKTLDQVALRRVVVDHQHATGRRR